MLRTVLGFDHIAKNVGDTWIANSGYDLVRTVPASGKPLIINDDGALTCTLGPPNTGPTQVAVNFSKYLVPGVDKVVVSFRTKVIAEGSMGPLFYIGSVVSGADANWSFAASIASSTWLLNSEIFFEVEINLVTTVVTVFANGVYMGGWAVSAAVNNAIKAGSLVLFFNTQGQNLTGQVSFRDFFLTDSAPGDGYVSRIGDRRVKKVDFDVATGTGWTTTNSADLLTTLKVAPETANPAFAVAPANKAPLSLSMKSTHADTFIVEGIAVHLAGKVDVLGAVNKVQMVDGANNTPPLALRGDFGLALKYGVTTNVFTRHPSGARWNNANIDSASFVLLPDQVS